MGRASGSTSGVVARALLRAPETVAAVRGGAVAAVRVRSTNDASTGSSSIAARAGRQQRRGFFFLPTDGRFVLTDGALRPYVPRKLIGPAEGEASTGTSVETNDGLADPDEIRPDFVLELNTFHLDIDSRREWDTLDGSGQAEADLARQEES